MTNDDEVENRSLSCFFLAVSKSDSTYSSSRNLVLWMTNSY